MLVWIAPGQTDFYHGYSGWRFIFFAGAAPVILAVPIALLLREPEPWLAAKKKARESSDPSKHVGSVFDLFRHPVWRHHTFVGIGLGLAGARCPLALHVEQVSGYWLPLHVPWSTIAIALGASLVIGVVASVLPSRRAARINVLDAITYE